MLKISIHSTNRYFGLKNGFITLTFKPKNWMCMCVDMHIHIHIHKHGGLIVKFNNNNNIM